MNERTNGTEWNENSKEEKLILIMKCMSVGLVDGSKLKLLLLIKLNGCILDLNQPNGTTCCVLLQANEERKAQSLNSILTLSSDRMNDEWNWRRVYVCYAHWKLNKLICNSLQTVSMGNWQSVLLLSFDLIFFYFHSVFLSFRSFEMSFRTCTLSTTISLARMYIAVHRLFSCRHEHLKCDIVTEKTMVKP